MAGEDEKVTAVFDLDTKDASSALGELKDAAQAVGSAKNVAGLVEGLGAVAAGAGGVLAAMLALKTTMDVVFAAEDIKAINQQFEILSARAGIAGESLKTALTAAADGLADDTDLIRAANRAIIEMGASAEKTPQVMELARKATAAMGGDLLQNFEKINHAIATGQTRALKQMGLIVDQEKAYRDYAASIGVAANALSEQGKQQALLNAVLARGQQSLGGVNADVKAAQNNWQAFKVAIHDIQEVFILAFDRVMGPAITRFTEKLKNTAHDFKVFATSVFGDGAEKAAASTELLNNKIKETEERLAKIQAHEGAFKALTPGEAKIQVEQLTIQLKHLKDELAAAQAQAAAGAGGEERGPSGEPVVAGGAGATDKAQERANEAEHLTALNQMRMQATTEQIAMADNEMMLDALRSDQKFLIEQELQAKIKAIKESTKLDADQKALQIEAAQSNSNVKILQMEHQLQQQRAAVWENHRKHATGVIEGIGAGFRSQLEKDRAYMTDWGTQGAETYGSLKQHATAAFEGIGSGQKKAGEAMRGMFFGVIGDRAVAEGSAMMMSGIWPPNPIAIAGGAALVAFGGLLKSKAGSHGGSVSPAGGGGGGGSFETASAKSDAIMEKQDKAVEQMQRVDSARGSRMGEFQGPAVSEFEAPKKTVTLQVQGNYFETEQTRSRLVEMMREATDATEFKYQQIGER